MQEDFQKQLLQSQIEVQEATFSALGKELHDNIGQLLSSTKMLLGITQRNIANAPDTLMVAEETLGKAIIELRSLSKSLDKEWLDQFDFIENLKTEVDRINAAKNLQVYFSYFDRLPLNPEKQIILFRIVQEAIQNAIKHSQAKTIKITVANPNSLLVVNVKDDGIGFEEISNLPGMGIRNMKHRTFLLNGTLYWDTSSGNGSSITIQLPLKENI